jgi:hypothetical protein
LRLGEDVATINDDRQQGSRAQELVCAVDFHSLLLNSFSFGKSLWPWGGAKLAPHYG